MTDYSALYTGHNRSEEKTVAYIISSGKNLISGLIAGTVGSFGKPYCKSSGSYRLELVFGNAPLLTRFIITAPTAIFPA